MKIKRDMQVREEKPLSAADMVSCYKSVFGGANGAIVYQDIMSFTNNLIGNGGIIDYRQPHHELAACAALATLRDYIVALTKEGEPNE